MKTYKLWQIHNAEPESEWVPAEVARRERDIHAANLSAIRIALGVLHAAGSDEDADRAAANLERVIENSGDVSHLNRLKAMWQAEGVRGTSNHILSVGSKTHKGMLRHDRYMYISSRALKEYADEILSQAQGANNEDAQTAR